MENQPENSNNATKPKSSHPLIGYARQSLVMLRNKFVLTIVVFLVWLTFFDRYNLVGMIEVSTNINKMKEEKGYYLSKIKQDSTRTKELTTNNENLEKYAREQYLMKRKDEVIFVVK